MLGVVGSNLQRLRMLQQCCDMLRLHVAIVWSEHKVMAILVRSGTKANARHSHLRPVQASIGSVKVSKHCSELKHA